MTAKYTPLKGYAERNSFARHLRALRRDGQRFKARMLLALASSAAIAAEKKVYEALMRGR